jgi:DNA invertase Pin-like site-specific DNA recombinase
MRLIGYIRVSRVAGREGESFISPAVQRERIEAMAAAQGHAIVDWQEDLDQPGSKWERPGFQAALKAVEAGEAEGVCVARLDRFARSVADAARGLERLEAADGALVAADLGMDTSTSAGRLMRNVLMALAEFELERVRENWAAAGSHAAERGVHVCKVPPAGYVRRERGKRLELDPVAAPVIAELFRRRAAGESWVTLCRFLDERLPQADGRHWSKSTVASLIRCRTFLGEARGGGVVNADAHPPIVSRAEFEAAQVAEADGRHERGADGGALLAGLVFCGSCGHAMTRISNGARGYHNYKCRKRQGDGLCEAPAGISIRRADALVEREFLAAVEREPLAAAGTPADGTLERALEALEVVERELAEYRDETIITAIGKDAYVEGLRRKQQAVDEARLALASANTGSPLDGLRNLRELWPDLDVRERRHLLGSVLDRAVVAPAPGAGKGVSADQRIKLVWR